MAQLDVDTLRQVFYYLHSSESLIAALLVSRHWNKQVYLSIYSINVPHDKTLAQLLRSPALLANLRALTLPRQGLPELLQLVSDSLPSVTNLVISETLGDSVHLPLALRARLRSLRLPSAQLSAATGLSALDILEVSFTQSVNLFSEPKLSLPGLRELCLHSLDNASKAGFLFSQRQSAFDFTPFLQIADKAPNVELVHFRGVVVEALATPGWPAVLGRLPRLVQWVLNASKRPELSVFMRLLQKFGDTNHLLSKLVLADYHGHKYASSVTVAIYEGNDSLVQRLIKDGADLNATRALLGHWPSPPLLEALRLGNVPIAKVLLAAGAVSIRPGAARSLRFDAGGRLRNSLADLDDPKLCALSRAAVLDPSLVEALRARGFTTPRTSISPLAMAVLQGDQPTIESIANMGLTSVDAAPERDHSGSFGVRYHPLAVATIAPNTLASLRLLAKLGVKDQRAIATAMMMCLFNPASVSREVFYFVKNHFPLDNPHTFADNGHTLLTAAVVGHLKGVDFTLKVLKDMIDAGIDINACNAFGFAPLHYSVAGGPPKSTVLPKVEKELLSAGPSLDFTRRAVLWEALACDANLDPNVPSTQPPYMTTKTGGVTPLHLLLDAEGMTYLEIRQFSSIIRPKLNTATVRNITPLMVAARVHISSNSGNAAFHGLTVTASYADVALAARDSEGRSAFTIACLNPTFVATIQKSKPFEWFEKNLKWAQIPIQQPGFIDPLLCLCDAKAHITVIADLIKEGADINFSSRLPCLRFRSPLWSRHSQVTLQADGEAGFLSSLERQEEEFARLPKEDGWTPLLYSAAHNRNSFASLLESGASVNTVTSSGANALHLLAAHEGNGFPAAANLLESRPLDAPTLLSATTTSGILPIDVALVNGKFQPKKSSKASLFSDWEDDEDIFADPRPTPPKASSETATSAVEFLVTKGATLDPQRPHTSNALVTSVVTKSFNFLPTVWKRQPISSITRFPGWCIFAQDLPLPILSKTRSRFGRSTEHSTLFEDALVEEQVLFDVDVAAIFLHAHFRTNHIDLFDVPFLKANNCLPHHRVPLPPGVASPSEPPASFQIRTTHQGPVALMVGAGASGLVEGVSRAIADYHRKSSSFHWLSPKATIDKRYLPKGTLFDDDEDEDDEWGAN